ncbi:MAG TPA: hypothetical protein DEP84_07675 [Chloroflexi bacterium]|nr:hypothetical protein [Chloroflexota bacterium]
MDYRTARFYFVVAILLISFVIMAVGCGPQPQPQSSGSAESSALSGQALIDAAKKEGQLNWYTMIQRDTAEEMARRFKETYGIDVEIVRETSAKVLQKFELEAKSGQVNADVMMASDLDAVIGFQEAGYLAPSQSPNGMRQATPQFRDEDGHWYTFYNLVYLMAYNSKLVPDAEAPKSWKDLADPQYKDKLVIAGLFPSGAPFVVLVEWYKLFGEEWLSAVAANNPMLVEGHAQMNTVVSAGERGIMAENAIHLIRQAEEAGVKPVWPTEGPMLFPVAVTKAKGAPHSAAADLFIDWVLSPEIQAWFTENYPSASAFPDIPLLYDIPPIDKAIVPDLGYVNSNRDKVWDIWKTKMNLK